MARFYGEVYGTRGGKASRMGHAALDAHIRGWNVGVAVRCRIVDRSLPDRRQPRPEFADVPRSDRARLPPSTTSNNSK